VCRWYPNRDQNFIISGLTHSLGKSGTQSLLIFDRVISRKHYQHGILPLCRRERSDSRKSNTRGSISRLWLNNYLRVWHML
jgi:hypothetical protein